MRDLAVFYCPKCGYYGYYQTSRHPQCPRCQADGELRMMRIHYAEFMHLTPEERDRRLCALILAENPSLCQRISASNRSSCTRELVAELNTIIMNLDTENKILSDTVSWMHDMIWELLRERRSGLPREAALTRESAR